MNCKVTKGKWKRMKSKVHATRSALACVALNYKLVLLMKTVCHYQLAIPHLLHDFG